MAGTPFLAGASDVEINAAFEKTLRGKKLSERERNTERAKLAQALGVRSEQRIQQIEEQENARGFIGQRAGEALSTAAAAANTATFNRLPQIAGLVGGPGSEQRMREGLEAMSRVNPAASIGGTIGGFISSGPAKLLTGGAAKLASAPAARVSAAVADKGFAARGASKFIENMIGGGAAITAFNAVEGSDPERTFQARITQSVNDTFSMANLGTSGVISLASAAILRRPSAELQPVFEKFRRITGRDVPPDVATNSVSLQGAYDLAQRTPGLEKAVADARTRLFKGLNDIVQEAGENAGAIRGQQGRAAASVRRLRGTRDAPGQATATRRNAQEQAFAAEGQRTLPAEAQQALMDSITRAARDRPGTEEVGSAFTKVIRSLRGAGTKGPLRMADIEGIRKRMGEIAFAVDPINPADPRISSRARIEAQRLYASVSEALDAGSPRIAREIRAGERLRRIDDALQDVRVSEVDDATLGSFWRASTNKNLLIQRYEALEEFATPEDVGAVKGWLFDSLVTASTNADGGISATKLATNMRKPGMFNRQVMDRVLPGVRGDLLRVAEVTERARRGVAKPLGSPTASVLLRASGPVAKSIGAAGFVATLLHNPFLAIGGAVGVTGLKWLTKRSISSMLGGRLGELVASGSTAARPGVGAARIPAGAGTLPQQLAPIGAATGATGLGPNVTDVAGGLGIGR